MYSIGNILCVHVHLGDILCVHQNINLCITATCIYNAMSTFVEKIAENSHLDKHKVNKIKGDK